EGGAQRRKHRGFAPRLRNAFLAFSLATILPTTAAAASIDDQFQAWLKSDLWPRARAAGVSAKTFNSAFAGVEPNLKLPDLVIPGRAPPKKQHQAESRAPAA